MLRGRTDRPRGRDRGRQVRLRLIYLDLWSCVKLSPLVSIVIAAVGLVLTIVVWSFVLDLGALGTADDLLHSITGDGSYSLERELSLSTVTGFGATVAALDVVIGTALGALTSVLYNLAVYVSGGVTIGLRSNRR